MKVTPLTRRQSKIRRQRRDLLAAGWLEVGERGGDLWRLHRGDLIGHRISDVIIAEDGTTLFIRTATAAPPTQQTGRMMYNRLENAASRAIGLHDEIATSHPSLSRGQVWCRTCGATRHVDAAAALRHGWPTCCGETMTTDAPDERKD